MTLRPSPGGAVSLRLVASALALAAVACSAEHPASSRCQADGECGDGNACAAGPSLPRAAAPAGWSIALTPRSDSYAAYTELAKSPAMPAAAFDLTATDKTSLTGTLTFDANAAPLKAAHVVLSVPSEIAGLPELRFETDLTAPPTFTLPIPSALVGRAGTLRVLPGALDSASHAPSTFSVKLTPALSLAVGSKAFVVQGRMLSAVGDPLDGLVARAFQGGDLLSDVVTTTGGAFTLLVSADVPANELAVELEPAASDSSLPHFWVKPFALTSSVDLGDIQLPAYAQPNPFRFAIHADSDTGPGVVGALVRARTLLSDDARGTTDFLRDGTTDASGQVSLSLLPGSPDALRLYDIAIVPPADSKYATQCLERFGVSAGGLQPSVTLARRAALSGLVVGADGVAVAGVVIQATRTSSDHATACDEYASAPQISGTTGSDGTFLLYVDPGTYTLDVDPPAGAPYPRLTETGVAAPAAGVMHQIQLPPGGVLEGTLFAGSRAGDASLSTLPQAGVRFYGPACLAPATCPGAPPALEAQARADANGHYRTVIPLLVPGPITQ